MRFDHQKAFPYPVLRPDINDYTDGEFQVTVDFSADDHSGVRLYASFALSVPELTERISNGTAVYALIVSCRETYYRDAILSAGPEVNKEYPADSLHGEVTVYPFVVAQTSVEGYTSSDINPEFGPGPFTYDLGEVLAAELPTVVYLYRDLFRPISSVFELVAKEGIAGFEFQLALDADRVQIQVNPAVKEIIDAARNSTPNRAVLINSIYFASVMQAIQVLKEGEGEAEYGELKWARVMKAKAHNMSLDLQMHDSYSLAQRLMHFPFQLLAEYIFRGEES